MKCAACGTTRARKLQRALVLTGPGTMKPGRVCAPCARLGWLLVLGEADPPPKRTKARTRARSPLVAHLLTDDP